MAAIISLILALLLYIYLQNKIKDEKNFMNKSDTKLIVRNKLDSLFTGFIIIIEESDVIKNISSLRKVYMLLNLKYNVILYKLLDNLEEIDYKLFRDLNVEYTPSITYLFKGKVINKIVLENIENSISKVRKFIDEIEDDYPLNNPNEINKEDLPLVEKTIG